MGWLADRMGRRNLMGIFFFGCGLACLGMSTASSSIALAFWLLVLGTFSAIYHPIGSAMLVTHARRLGRALGVNGVWGNLGAAFASGTTALLAQSLGWRGAFIVPGLVCLAAGFAFLRAVPDDGEERGHAAGGTTAIPVSRPRPLLAMFAAAIVAGGITFNIVTIGLPKIVDEGVRGSIPLALTGSIATAVFVVGALTQLLMGRLVDRFPLPNVFVGLSVLQPIGLAIAAFTVGVPMLAGIALAMAAIYGQVVVNDAMVARYVPREHRAKAYSLRYFLGFTTSGLVVPLISVLHGPDGFGAILSVAALSGAVVFLCSVAFYCTVAIAAQGSQAPAE
jgi:MFS family permease